MSVVNDRDCLVCDHTEADHQAVAGQCSGTDGLCQCHGYNPDEHPVQRLTAAREAASSPAGRAT